MKYMIIILQVYFIIFLFIDKKIVKFVENYCNKWQIINDWKNKEIQNKTVNNWINEMNENMKKGNYLEALYEIINIRSKCKEIYIRNNMVDLLNGKILIELRNKEFPVIEYYNESNIAKVDIKVINSFERMFDIYKKIMSLCSEDAKNVINLPKIMYDIILGIIYYITSNDNAEKAKFWLNKNNISYGVMFAYIENWEYAKNNNLNLLKIVNNLPSIVPDNINNNPILLNNNENVIWEIMKSEKNDIKTNNNIYPYDSYINEEEKKNEINLNDINIFDECKSENIFSNIPNYGNLDI